MWRQDIPAMKNNIRKTSESSNIRWNWKVRYGRPYTERKGKPSVKVKIINKDEPWRISHLKEWAHMWGYNDLLSGEIIVINTNGNQ